MIVMLAFLLGIANAVDMPVRQAFAIEMVGRKDIGNAVALNSAMFNGARVIGPAVAGLAIAAFGVGPAFVINAFSFLAVIVGLLTDARSDELARPRIVARPRSGGTSPNLDEGLRFVWQTPVVLLAVTVVGLVATVGMNFNVLIPAFAQDDLGSDAAGYGFLMAASGLGSLTAAMRLVFGGRPRPIRLAHRCDGPGRRLDRARACRGVRRSLVLMFLIGFGGILMAATGNTTIQLAVPDHLRGRVMSVYTTVFTASVPVGGLAMGALASAAGIAVAIAVGGVLTLVDRHRRPRLVAPRGRLASRRRCRPGARGLEARPAAAAPPSRAVRERHRRGAVDRPAPSGAPNTSAAFSPPKPNEVDSTRR